jgi:hypothetical protein
METAKKLIELEKRGLTTVNLDFFENVFSRIGTFFCKPHAKSVILYYDNQKLLDSLD